jgi:hypothetical protein
MGSFGSSIGEAIMVDRVVDLLFPGLSGKAAKATLLLSPVPKSSSSPIGPGNIKLNSLRVGTIFLLVPPTVTLRSGEELLVANENVRLLALLLPAFEPALDLEDRRRLLLAPPLLDRFLCFLVRDREDRRRLFEADDFVPVSASSSEELSDESESELEELEE